MKHTIQELLKIAPAPTNPVANGNVSQWQQVENDLSLVLPEDYKLIVNFYGVGSFRNTVFLISPFGRDNDYRADNFSRNWIESYASMYAHFRDNYSILNGNDEKHRVYPEVGGIIPLGGLDNGSVMYYSIDTHGHSRLIFYSGDFFETFVYSGDLVSFLITNGANLELVL